MKEIRSLKIWSINIEKIICTAVVEIEETDWSINKIIKDLKRVCDQYKLWKHTFEIKKSYKPQSSKDYLVKRKQEENVSIDIN